MPFPAPNNTRTVIAIGKLVETPQTKNRIMVVKSPVMIVGFRPKVSAAVPQETAVVLCATEKAADVRPAHFATSFCSTPKLRIISGRYGKTDVSAKGSANLAMAASEVSRGPGP